MNLRPTAKTAVVDAARCRQLCTCGCGHPPPTVQYHIGEDAFECLAADCRQHFSGETVLLVDDVNTHAAAGKRVAALLSRQQIRFDVVTLPRDSVATGETAGEISGQAAHHALIVAVGSGTINDLGKYAAGERNIPYWTVPTAPSMNGFTSAIAAIKIAGVKRTLPSPPPQFVYVHPEVIRMAPLQMRQAGFCDLMAKSVSDTDWHIESLLFSGTYCRLPSAIVAEAEETYLKAPEKIQEGDKQAVIDLMKGLLISGVAMSLAGSSAPASGGEHLFSHFLDMRADLTGRPPELHGLQVAAGIVLSAACYRKLAALDRRSVRGNAERVFQSAAAKILSVWGPLAAEVEKRLLIKRDMLLQLDQKLPEKWETIRSFCRQVSDPEQYVNAIRRTGYPLDLCALNLNRKEYLLAASAARTIRDRLTVLDIAAHCGVLDAAAAEALELMVL